MNLIKCDRCGKAYEPDILGVSFNDYRVIGCTLLFGEHIFEHEYDLCPD